MTPSIQRGKDFALFILVVRPCNLIGCLSNRIPDHSAERPLTYNSYDSLHDPHCRSFFLNSRVFRRHLERQGLVTSDMRVVAAPNEQRQRVRAHELLERREMLVEKVTLLFVWYYCLANQMSEMICIILHTMVVKHNLANLIHI